MPIVDWKERQDFEGVNVYLVVGKTGKTKDVVVEKVVEKSCKKVVKKC